jgi:hypothetical protein
MTAPMPPSSREERIRAELRSAKKMFDMADDDGVRLAAGFAALRFAINYFLEDREIAEEFLTQPLAIVENAVFNTWQGAKPRLFQRAPREDGPPRNTSQEYAQGCLAHCLELFVSADWSLPEAAEWIAAEARRHGIRCDDGSTVAAKQIIGWRSEIRRQKGAVGAREMFEGWHREHRELLRLNSKSNPTKPRECARLARDIIKSVAATAPLCLPHQKRERSPKTRQRDLT